tara:strand:+ start:411 stop:2102 length:1692 start_codon:yes stop_codon:yes gene_type:complete
MLNIIIFFSSFYLLLISVIGYGLIFKILIFGSFKDMTDQKSIYIGFYGLFFITFVSVITSLVIPHNFIHNCLLHLFGILFFIFLKFENKKEYFKKIFLISFFVIIALLISKTHDDFSYYHLPFTRYLTEQKVIFGIGNLQHGFKLLSSLFFLNSTFYLPFIDYYSFHFTLIFFLIFFNYFLLKEIFSAETHEVSKFLYLFAFIFFNLSFNRLAEYGTDKAGQLLIVILIIKIFQITCLERRKNNLDNFLFVIPLLAFCISLKTYFIPYLLLGLTILFLQEKFIKSLKIILFSRNFLIIFLALSVYFFHHFISTGCLISPISITCFGDNLEWARGSKHYSGLSLWLEQWAKAGAGPDFRIEDPYEYIKNFNWIPRWFENYFLEKVVDQLLILFSAFLVILFLFKKFNFKNTISIFDKKVNFFYSIILIIFLIWITKHPTLRYGGYPIVFLTLSIPVAILYQKIANRSFFEKRLKILLILVVVLFNIKNLDRINDEFKRNDYYKFTNFPFFAIDEKEYYSEKTPSGLVIYKTKGHCWNTPSPCTSNIEKFGFEIEKKYGFYFFNR